MAGDVVPNAGDDDSHGRYDELEMATNLRREENGSEEVGVKTVNGELDGEAKVVGLANVERKGHANVERKGTLDITHKVVGSGLDTNPHDAPGVQMLTERHAEECRHPEENRASSLTTTTTAPLSHVLLLGMQYVSETQYKAIRSVSAQPKRDLIRIKALERLVGCQCYTVSHPGHFHEESQDRLMEPGRHLFGNFCRGVKFTKQVQVIAGGSLPLSP
jgi:hypothetical protein